jgi:hypothetical protein
LPRVLESGQQKSANATALLGRRPTAAALGSALASAGRLVGKSEITSPEARRAKLISFSHARRREAQHTGPRVGYEVTIRIRYGYEHGCGYGDTIRIRGSLEPVSSHPTVPCAGRISANCPAGSSGDFLPPSPPAEKATARQDQAVAAAGCALEKRRRHGRSASLRYCAEPVRNDALEPELASLANTVGPSSSILACLLAKAAGSLVRRSNRQLGVDGR